MNQADLLGFKLSNDNTFMSGKAILIAFSLARENISTDIITSIAKSYLLSFTSSKIAFACL